MYSASWVTLLGDARIIGQPYLLGCVVSNGLLTYSLETLDANWLGRCSGWQLWQFCGALELLSPHGAVLVASTALVHGEFRVHDGVEL